jgi:hypothetical protein
MRKLISCENAALLAFWALVALPTGVYGQSVPQPPTVQLIDQNHVNIGSGIYDLPGLELSIGTAQSGLTRTVLGTGYTAPGAATGGGVSPSYKPADNFSDGMWIYSQSQSASGGSVYANVSHAGEVHQFYVGYYSTYPQNQTFNSGVYQEIGGKARLTCTSTALRSVTGSCTMTTEDGTAILYDRTLALPDPALLQTYNASKFCAFGTIITKPDGEFVTITYDTSTSIRYTQSVSSSLGWMLKFHWDSTGNYDQITGINTSVTYCAPSAASCAVPSNFPTVSASTSGSTTTLYKNGVQLLSYALTGGLNYPAAYGTATLASPSGTTTTITKANQTTSDWTITYARGSSTWSYSFKTRAKLTIYDNWTTFDASVKNPDLSIHSSQTGKYGKIVFTTDELSRTKNYTFGGYNLTRFSPPEGTANGGYTDFTYDSVNRLLSSTNKAKYASGLADQLTTLAYVEAPTTALCASPKVCNKPLWVRDAKGNLAENLSNANMQTDYTYSPAHGGILTETGPADSAGVRPQTRYTYTQLYPKILNASNVLVNSTPVWRLTKTSSCRTATAANPASCVGTDQETVTEFEYANNNLLLTKVTVRAGNANVGNVASASNVWQSKSYDYDTIGNQTLVDGPLPGTVDQSYIVYDVLRRPVYEIGIDPDGAGTLPSVAVHHMYDIDGREYRTETGRGIGANMRTCSPTAATCTDFAMTSYVQRTYNATTGLEAKSITAQP